MNSNLRRVSAFERRVRRPTTTGTGWTTIPAGQYLVTWEAEIDESRLRAMASRALQNKAGKSKCGPVTVRILKSTIEGSILQDARKCEICSRPARDGFDGECHNCKIPLCDACSDSHACEAV